MQTRPRLRRFLRRLAFACFLCVAALVFLEGLASLYWTLSQVAAPRREGERERVSGSHYDPELGWTAVPNLYVPDMFGSGVYLRNNAQGFRSNQEYFSPEPPPGTLRMVCSGDSFTMGYGVNNDQTWCELLAKYAGGLEAVNLGQIGYGVDQVYLRYKRDAANLGHHLHVVAFITADFDRMASDQFLGYAKPVLEVEQGALAVKNVPVPRGRFVVPFWLEQRLRRLEELRSVQLLRGWARQLVPPPKPRHGHLQLVRIVRKVFDELERLNRAKGSTMVLVYLPTQSDRLSDASKQWRKSLSKLAAQRKWIYFDLMEELRALDRREALPLFRPEGHYSVAGNELMARSLHRRLMSVPGLAERLAPPGPQ